LVLGDEDPDAHAADQLPQLDHGVDGPPDGHVTGVVLLSQEPDGGELAAGWVDASPNLRAQVIPDLAPERLGVRHEFRKAPR
jgi:hypothetical protein